MLFSEVYGTYYNVLAQLLSKAVEGDLTRETMFRIVRQEGFEESVLTIPEALESQTWPLITKDCTTPLEHKPTRPLTTLQKRWLKALLNDPRIRLFDPPMDGLEDVQPLYPPDTFVYYDRYNDGDPFDDPEYIRHFRCILSAIRHKRWLRIQFTGRSGQSHFWRCIPYKLEYCPKPMTKRILVLELTDERNALERAMLHFSHLDKETQRIEGNRYKITLYYEREDETELLIRVLSFGPVLKVVFPEDFIKKLCERLEKQKRMRTQE